LKRALLTKKKAVCKHFEGMAISYDDWKGKNDYYYFGLKKLIKRFIPAGSTVLELGCATGDILDELRPRRGMGVDISASMMDIAGDKHPWLEFIVGDAHSLDIKEKFEYVILPDIVDHLVDVQSVFQSLHSVIKEGSTVIITTINPLWGPIFSIAERLHMKMSEGEHRFWFKEDIVNLLYLEDFEVVESGYSMLLPKRIPLISKHINDFAAWAPILRSLCLIQYIAAKPMKSPRHEEILSVSVVIPCHNESGNIRECISRVPRMGRKTEIIVVDDGSADDTRAIVEGLLKKVDNLRLISYEVNQGKGHADKYPRPKGRGIMDVIEIV
jgi:ubiquinone/menaquinone biosynthesis C-methylase UbiE